MDLRDVEKIAHHLAEKFARTGLTFDDVLIEPRFSTVVPTAVEVGTRLTQPHLDEHPDPQLADGHGDRERDGDRPGARGRARRDP